MYPTIGEYFIAIIDKKKFILKAKKVKKDLITAKDAFDKNQKDEIVNVHPNDVMCSLGTKPKVGGAYGVWVEVYRKTIDTELGYFDFFCSPKKELVEKIKDAAKRVKKKMRKHGINLFTSYTDFRVRYAKSEKDTVHGCYKHNKKGFGTLSLYTTKGNDFTYTLFHECGHAVWFRQVPDRYKGKWVKDYNKYIEVEHIKEKELRNIMLRLVDGSFSTASECKKEINKEGSELEKELMKFAIEYLRKTKRLSIQDLDYIMIDRNYDLIKSIWPRTTVDLSIEKMCPISQYATKNVKEFFAESFALYMTGKKLPKRIKKLMEKTLRNSTNLLEDNGASPDETE